MVGRQDGRAVVVVADHRLHGGAPAVVDAVRLVQDHEVGECDVLAEVRVLRRHVLELLTVHHHDQTAVHDVRVGAAENEPNHVARLGKSARLDDDHVDLRRGMRQAVQHLVHVADVHGAAHAAVAQRHHGIDLTGHHHRIDVHGAEVVDDDATRTPRLLRSTWLSRVVFPEPRNPATMTTGIRFFANAATSVGPRRSTGRPS